MCGIVGMASEDLVAESLLAGLKELEYRGYDAAGLACHTGSMLKRVRAIGPLKMLQEKWHQHKEVQGKVGLAHTRWATHGAVTLKNTHPHGTQRVMVAQNGIIENMNVLRERFTAQGYVFESDTDAELLVAAFSEVLTKEAGQGLKADNKGQGKGLFIRKKGSHIKDPVQTASNLHDPQRDAFQVAPQGDVGDFIHSDMLEDLVKQSLRSFEGSFSALFLLEDVPNVLIAYRQGFSTLLLGEGKSVCAASSDIAGFPSGMQHFYALEDKQWAVLSAEGVWVREESGVWKKPLWRSYKARETASDKGAYPHFMLKEIHDQPFVIQNLIQRYNPWRESAQQESEPGVSGKADLVWDHQEMRWQERESLCLSACGTAYYAALLGGFFFESEAGLKTTVDIASEVPFKKNALKPGELFVVLSQSGETADTLAAAAHAKKQGQHTFGLLNVTESALGRLLDKVLALDTGPEVSVASTKAFMAQSFMMCVLALEAARARGLLTLDAHQKIWSELKQLPTLIAETLKLSKDISTCARVFQHARSMIYLGRGPFYPLALEGALKMTEIAYIHAQGYAAGEIKHGPIALIEKGFPVVVLAPSGTFFEKSVATIQEVLARGAQVLALTDAGAGSHLKGVENVTTLKLPEMPERLAPFAQAVVLQLLAYHTAVHRGQNVDRPRNLAKSVTVE